MKITLFFFYSFFFFIVFNGLAQQKKIDSLKLELEKHIIRDSVQLNMLNELSYNYYFVNPDEGVKIANKAIALAKSLKRPLKLATSYANKGHNHNAQGQDSLALLMYDLAINIRRENNDQNGLARLIYNKGLVYFNQSDYNRANDNNIRAYEVFKVEKDSFLMAKMLNSIGLNQMYLTKYPEALSSYLEAKLIYEDLNSANGLEYANINANIGLLYSRLEKYDLALESQEDALYLFKKLDFEEGIANAITSIGRVYASTGKTQKALLKYEEAFHIMNANNNERGTASALTNMGSVYVELKQYEKAISYFQKTKRIYERLKNTNNLAIVHDNLGDCYLNLSSLYNINKAEVNYKIALKFAKQARSLNLQFKAHEKLALVQSKKGDYKGAYTNKTNALVLRDSFNSVEKKEEIARLEVKYEYEKEKSILQTNFDKQQAIALAEVEKQKLQYMYIGVGGLLLFLTIIIVFFLYKKKMDALAEKKISEFNTRVAETKLIALRSQMNPHFIFNALNSISDYMNKNDTQTANSYLMKFAKLTRSILENSEKKWITLQDDTALTELYIQIESLRLKNKFSYKIDIDEVLDTENIMVLPMLLQPFIENSIWHGLAKKEGKGNINIRIAKEQEMLTFMIEDDGVGRNKTVTNQLEKKSMGIKIAKSRLDIISQLKKGEGSIEMFEKAEGFCVKIKVPLELRF